MWIFTSRAFLSIVRHSVKPDILIVRSRFPNHIEAIFPEAHITENDGTDYRYRAELNQKEVSQAIAKMILKIDYSNFKGSLNMNEQDYLNCCFDVYDAVLKNACDLDFCQFKHLREELNEA